MSLVYSTNFISKNGFFKNSVNLFDDWLKRDRFIFIGWSGLILLPTVYLSLGSWFTGTSFVTSWFTHGLVISYLKGCNFLTSSVSTFSNCMGHSLLLLWGSESQGLFTRQTMMGGLWTFLSFYRLLGVISFSLRQFEISRLVSLRPYNAIAFTGFITTYTSVFLIYPLS